MMEGGGQDISLTSVSVRPKNIYGLRMDVIGNIHFNLNQEVIYPVEGALAFHDFVSNKQRFLRFPDETHPLIIAISSHRRLLAVLEDCLKIGSSISIYDLTSLKKRRSLELPNESKGLQIAQIAFTQDSKAIVVLTKGPEEMLFMMVLDKTSKVIEGRPTNNYSRGMVESIAINPQESGLIAVCGENILMTMCKSEKGFTITNNIKSNFYSTSMAFLAVDLLMVGTSEDELILVENGEIKFRQKASDAEIFDLLWEADQMERELEHRILTDVKLYDKRVVCMTAFPMGFAFAIYNKVFVFEKVPKSKFERKTILTIPITIYADHLYQITNMAIDSKQETVIVTTKHSQIYVGILIVPETLKAKHLKFQPLGVLLHIADIIDVSLCSWKPIIMTALIIAKLKPKELAT